MKYLITSLLLLLLPTFSGAESIIGIPGTATARLQIQVVVPRTIQIIESPAPTLVENGQYFSTIKVTTNVRSLCISARSSNEQLYWYAFTNSPDWTEVRSAGDTRFCSKKIGHSTLVITYQFTFPNTQPQPWPIRLVTTDV